MCENLVFRKPTFKNNFINDGLFKNIKLTIGAAIGINSSKGYDFEGLLALL